MKYRDVKQISIIFELTKIEPNLNSHISGHIKSYNMRTWKDIREELMSTSKSLFHYCSMMYFPDSVCTILQGNPVPTHFYKHLDSVVSPYLINSFEQL